MGRNTDSDKDEEDNTNMFPIIHNNNGTLDKLSGTKFLSTMKDGTIESNGDVGRNCIHNWNKGRIQLNRDAIDYEDLSHKYGKLVPTREGIVQKISHFTAKCCSCADCSCSHIFRFIFSIFPIFSWLREYSIKHDLINDLIAGFTISILHIPQGMAYGLLAGLNPINGLYVSFFPVLVYVLMGTSRHVSIGTFAIMSIMLRSTLSNVESEFNSDFTGNQLNSEARSLYSRLNESSTYSLSPPTQLEIATAVCIFSGFIQLAMGVLQLGALSLIFSDQLVSGFSTGAAMHVATSQIDSLFDMTLPRRENQPFKLLYVWYDIFTSLKNANRPYAIP